MCAVTRAYYLKVIFFETYDVTWWVGPVYVTTCVEASFGITCASAPALKIFFKKYFDPVQFGSSFGNAISMSVRTGRSKGNTNPTNLSTVDTDIKSGYQLKNMTGGGHVGAGPHDTELKGISVTREVEVASAYTVKWCRGRRSLRPGHELRARILVQQRESR